MPDWNRLLNSLIESAITIAVILVVAALVIASVAVALAISQWLLYGGVLGVHLLLAWKIYSKEN